MASVLVKNLPSASAINGTDLVIVNIGEGEEYVTSNMSIAEFKTALNSNGTGSNDLTGDVKVDGNVTITKVGSKFVGDLNGTADSVDSLTNHTADNLTPGDTNKYFTDANAAELTSLRVDLTATDNSVGLGDADTLADSKSYTDILVADTVAFLRGEDTGVLADSKTYTDAVSGGLVIDITNEAETARAAELANENAILAETERAKAAEQANENAILAIDLSGITTNSAAISTEEARAKLAEAANEANIATNAGNIATNVGNIATNAGNIADNVTAISAEQARAEAAEALKVSKTTSITFSGSAGGDATANAAAIAALNTAVAALVAAMNA
jgi:hypothetical protein